MGLLWVTGGRQKTSLAKTGGGWCMGSALVDLVQHFLKAGAILDRVTWWSVCGISQKQGQGLTGCNRSTPS